MCTCTSPISMTSTSYAAGLAPHNDVRMMMLDYTASRWTLCMAIHTVDLHHLIEDFLDTGPPVLPWSTYLLLLHRHITAMLYERQVTWQEQMVFICCQFGTWTVLIDCTCSVHRRMSHSTAALCCLLSDLLVLAVTDWCTFWLNLHVLAKYYSCSCRRKTAHSLSHKHKLACMTHTETHRLLPHIFATCICTLCQGWHDIYPISMIYIRDIYPIYIRYFQPWKYPIFSIFSLFVYF